MRCRCSIFVPKNCWEMLLVLLMLNPTMLIRRYAMSQNHVLCFIIYGTSIDNRIVSLILLLIEVASSEQITTNKKKNNNSKKKVRWRPTIVIFAIWNYLYLSPKHLTYYRLEYLIRRSADQNIVYLNILATLILDTFYYLTYYIFIHIYFIIL